MKKLFILVSSVLLLVGIILGKLNYYLFYQDRSPLLSEENLQSIASPEKEEELAPEEDIDLENPKIEVEVEEEAQAEKSTPEQSPLLSPNKKAQKELDKLTTKKKLKAYYAKLQKKIAVKILDGPEGGPISLNYAVQEICKAAKVPFWKKDVPEGEEPVGAVISHNAKASELIKIYAKTKGLKFMISSRGIYLKKIQADPIPVKPTPSENLLVKESNPSSFTENSSVKFGKKNTKNLQGNTYLHVPLEGGFGMEITPKPIRKIFEHAKKQDVKHIVMTIDSQGGYVQTADEILKLMLEYDSYFQYHLIVERAISASIWIVFSSDFIYLRSHAVIGGAVVYRMNEIGNAEVDAKMNSIIAAQVTSAAEAKGHPAYLVNPMIIQKDTLGVWKDWEGKIHHSDQLESGISSEDIIIEDTEESVLTLTAKQASEVRLGRLLSSSDPDSLGEVLGISGWRAESDYGEKVMLNSSFHSESNNQKHEEAYEKMTALQKEMQEYINLAQARDPRNFTYDKSYSGGYTNDAKKKWRQLSDESSSYWRKTLQNANKLKTMNNKNKKNGISLTFPEENLRKIIEVAESEMKRLYNSRNLRNQ